MASERMARAGSGLATTAGAAARGGAGGCTCASVAVEIPAVPISRAAIAPWFTKLPEAKFTSKHPFPFSHTARRCTLPARGKFRFC
jgi:hypothetical protein